MALQELVDPDEAPGDPLDDRHHLRVVDPGLRLPLEQPPAQCPGQTAAHRLDVVSEEDPAEAAPQLQVSAGARAGGHRA